MAHLGVSEGAFNDRESKILSNLFKLGSITLKSIYTPRTVMFAFQEEKTIREFLDQNSQEPFSRIIVFKENLDQVTGFVHKNDIFTYLMKDLAETPLKTIKRSILVFPIFTTISEVLESLLKEKQHIALVVDEFGTLGLVTIEDIFETLLGIEIIDETDNTTNMQSLAKELWRQRMQRLGLDSKLIQELEDAVMDPVYRKIESTS